MACMHAVHMASWHVCSSYGIVACMPFIRHRGMDAVHMTSWQGCRLYGIVPKLFRIFIYMQVYRFLCLCLYKITYNKMPTQFQSSQTQSEALLMYAMIQDLIQNLYMMLKLFYYKIVRNWKK